MGYDADLNLTPRDEEAYLHHRDDGRLENPTCRGLPGAPALFAAVWLAGAANGRVGYVSTRRRLNLAHPHVYLPQLGRMPLSSSSRLPAETAVILQVGSLRGCGPDSDQRSALTHDTDGLSFAVLGGRHGRVRRGDRYGPRCGLEEPRHLFHPLVKHQRHRRNPTACPYD